MHAESRVVRGAGLSGGVSWRALLSGAPPSAKAISSGAGSSTDTECPRDLHEAGLHVLPLRRRRARRLRRPWHAAPAGGAMSREWPSRHMDWPGSKVIPHPTNLRPSSSQTNPTASRSHARRVPSRARGRVKWRRELASVVVGSSSVRQGNQFGRRLFHRHRVSP